MRYEWLPKKGVYVPVALMACMNCGERVDDLIRKNREVQRREEQALRTWAEQQLFGRVS